MGATMERASIRDAELEFVIEGLRAAGGARPKRQPDWLGVWIALMARSPASQLAPLVPMGRHRDGVDRADRASGAAELAGAALVLGGLLLTVGLTAPPRARDARHERTGKESPHVQARHRRCLCSGSRHRVRRAGPGGRRFRRRGRDAGPALGGGPHGRRDRRRSIAGRCRSPHRRRTCARCGGPASAPSRGRRRPSPRRRRLPQLRGDERARSPRCRRAPGHRQPVQPRERPTRAGTCGRSRSPTTSATDEDEPEVLFTPGQHAREHLTVEMALTCSTSSPTGTAPTADHGASSTRARSGSSSTSTRTAASTTSPPAPTARGARTASPTPARARSAPTSTATGATGGAAAAARAARRRPRPTAARRAFSAPETQARARLRQQPRGRRRAADHGRASTSTPTSELVLWPYGYTTPTPPPDMTADDHDAFAAIGQEMAAHQRLHARAGERPVHHRRHDRRLAVGQPQDLRLHVRDVPDGLGGRGFYPPDEVIEREIVAQPRGGAAAARELRLPVPGRSARRRPVLRHRDAGRDAVLR